MSERSGALVAMKQLVVDDALGLQWWHLARVRRDEQLRVYVGRGDQGWRPDWGASVLWRAARQDAIVTSGRELTERARRKASASARTGFRDVVYFGEAIAESVQSQSTWVSR